MANPWALAALVIGIIGLNFMTKATMGVGIICFGCLVAIIARVRQQETHHAETMQQRIVLAGKQSEKNP